MVELPDLPDQVDETELPNLLAKLLDRAANGGATVVTRDGQPIAAIVSMRDYEVAEDAIDDALAARKYDDDGTRYSLDDVFEDDGTEGGR